MVATFVELLQRKPTTHYHKFMEVLKRTNQIFVYEEMERRRHEKIELKRLNKHGRWTQYTLLGLLHTYCIMMTIIMIIIIIFFIIRLINNYAPTLLKFKV